MRSIARLFSAFSTLADSVLSLASVLDAGTARLRQQLALDGEAAPPAVLEHQPAGECDRVSENGMAKRKSRAGG